MTTRLEIKSEKDVDAMLAKDLNLLSIEERENIFEAMHGVDQTVEESETLIQTSLIELEQELDKIKDNKKAYNMAISGGKMKKDYVTSRKFRLMFLRAENFAVDKAAQRMVVFMKKILQYFGPDVLGRPLYYSDLLPESRDYLSKGTIQLLRGKDSTGRAVYIYHYQRSTQIEKTSAALLQTYIFFLWSIIENDEISQMRGVVGIGIVMGKLKRCCDQDAYLDVAKFPTWLPYKLQAVHLCFDNPTVGLFEPLMWLVVGREVRQRTRIHNGTHTEVMYSIQSFGIPTESVPMNGKGELQYESHHKWIARQKEKDPTTRGEQTSLLFDTAVDAPAPNDVALWRGRVYQKHPGNIRMRGLIDEYREEYDSSKKGEKAGIAMKIVQKIKTVHKGRFLTQDPCGQWWVEVSDKEAQLRVSKAFRSSRIARNTTVPVVVEKKVSQFGNKRFRLDNVPSLLPTSAAQQGPESTSCCNFPFPIVIPPRLDNQRI